MIDAIALETIETLQAFNVIAHPGVGMTLEMSSRMMSMIIEDELLKPLQDAYPLMFIYASDQHKRYRVDIDSGTAYPIEPMEENGPMTSTQTNAAMQNDQDVAHWIEHHGYRMTPILLEHVNRAMESGSSFGMNKLIKMQNGHYDGEIVAVSKAMEADAMSGYTAKSMLTIRRSQFIWDIGEFNRQWMQSLTPNDRSSYVDISYLSCNPNYGFQATQQYRSYTNRYRLVDDGNLYHVSEGIGWEECDRPVALR